MRASAALRGRVLKVIAAVALLNRLAGGGALRYYHQTAA